MHDAFKLLNPYISYFVAKIKLNTWKYVQNDMTEHLNSLCAEGEAPKRQAEEAIQICVSVYMCVCVCVCVCVWMRSV